MIKSRKDLEEYLEADSKYYKNTFGIKGCLRSLITTPISDQKYIWRYIKTMRYAEYWINKYHTNKTPMALWYLHKLRKYGRITGFQIHPGTIGKGLTIFHFGTIIVSGKSQIGENCVMRPPILLGHKTSDAPAPKVGDNVEINSGVKLIGNISIGDDVILGANSVVAKSVPSHSIVIGIPGRIIKRRKDINSDWTAI